MKGVVSEKLLLKFVRENIFRICQPKTRSRWRKFPLLLISGMAKLTQKMD